MVRIKVRIRKEAIEENTREYRQWEGKAAEVRRSAPSRQLIIMASVWAKQALINQVVSPLLLPELSQKEAPAFEHSRQ
jgi:hypothetical protein